MKRYLILARSVTHAQRIQRVLARKGIRNRIFRAPANLTESGCAYAVELISGNVLTALYILRCESIQPLKIYEFQNGTYREVLL